MGIKRSCVIDTLPPSTSLFSNSLTEVEKLHGPIKLISKFYIVHTMHLMCGLLATYCTCAEKGNSVQV